MRREPRAVVRSTLPEAEAALSAPVRTAVPGAVRNEVRARSAGAAARVQRAVWEPVRGDARGAAATSRSDARNRRSRRGRAKRGR